LNPLLYYKAPEKEEKYVFEPESKIVESNEIQYKEKTNVKRCNSPRV
jgi:hypothetical protein